MIIQRAKKNDLKNIFDLQKKAFVQEAQLYSNFKIQPMMQTLNEIEEEYNEKIFLKAMIGEVIVGSVRANTSGTECHIHKLIVHPGFQCQGIGGRLMNEIEKLFTDSTKYKLSTGAKSENNIRFYTHLGYRIVKKALLHDGAEGVIMEKLNKHVNT